MPAITFVNEDETTIETNADIGGTLMEAALEAEVPGIPAVCGGACSCATCHVHLDKDWYERLGEPDFTEKSILGY